MAILSSIPKLLKIVFQDFADTHRDMYIPPFFRSIFVTNFSCMTQVSRFFCEDTFLPFFIGNVNASAGIDFYF